MIIRTAERRDMESMLEIYNREVMKGTATFDLGPKELPEWEQWFARHNKDNHPLIVAKENGMVLGYACLSPYRTLEAYLQTVELSIYVGVPFRKRGVATALMEHILRLAREDAGTHMVVSVITSDNEVSIKLHEKFGFTYCGTMHEMGLKFGAYRDISNYELRV